AWLNLANFELLMFRCAISRDAGMVEAAFSTEDEAEAFADRFGGTVSGRSPQSDCPSRATASRPTRYETLRSRFAGIPDDHYGNDTRLFRGDIGVSQWTLSGTRVDGERG